MPESGNDKHLGGFSTTVSLPVAWGEMDALGHVNNAVFFRYFESARIAYLEEIGLDGSVGTVGPILGSTHCKFFRPIIFPDHIRIGARAVRYAADRFEMEYRIFSERLEAVAAEGGAVVVAFDYKTRAKASLPRAVVDRIRALDPQVRKWDR